MSLKNEECMTFVFKIFYSLLILLLSELIYRILSIIKKIWQEKHFQIKEQLNIIRNGFTFNTTEAKISHTFLIFIFTPSILSLIFPEINEIINMWRIFEQIHLVPVYIIIRYIGISQGRFEQEKWIKSGNGLDRGTAMAASFLHGYLLLALAKKCDNDKGIVERIEEYEEIQKVEFALRKLVIVVPESLNCPPQVNSQYLERVTPLRIVTKYRGGAKRPFENTVYRFTKKVCGKQNYYIAFEYATILQSFKDSLDSTITCTTEMKAMRKYIVNQFHKCLKDYTSEYRKEFEIILYKDDNPNEDNLDIGKFLMDYLEMHSGKLGISQTKEKNQMLLHSN